MRSTAPSLRRRNHARLRNTRRWLSPRDGSDSEDGFASGEDPGPDSDSDDDDVPIVRPARPAAGVGQANPAARVDGVPAARLGAGAGSASSRAVQPVVQPVTRTTARPAVQPVTRPIAQSTSRPVIQPVTRPVAQPVAQPVVRPVAPPVVLQPVAPPSPSASPVLPGVTLGADEAEGDDDASDSVSDGIESGIESDSDDLFSDDETTTPGAPPPATPPPAGATPALAAPPGVGLPPPAATATQGANPVLAPADPAATATLTPLPLQSTTSSNSPNQATGAPTTSLDLTTTLAIPPGRTEVTDAQAENESVGNTLGPVAAEDPPVNAGMAAGIVVGVLALIGLLVGAAFFYKKWKRNGGELPPLPLFRRSSEKDDGPDMAYNGNTMEKDTIPILPPPSFGTKKTNSEMMDHLMQATYRTESGTYDPETGTFGQNAGAQNETSTPALAPDPYRPGFLDEKAYTALAGPPTPMNKPKPVLQWLDNIKTPRQSGVVRWPSTDAPPIPPSSTQSTMQDPPQVAPQPFNKPPIPNFLPPEPAFKNEARYTTTTTTTTTSGSSAWYG